MFILLSCAFVVFFFFLRIRLPPRSTRTAPLFPDTTLFRSLRLFRGGFGRAFIFGQPAIKIHKRFIRKYAKPRGYVGRGKARRHGEQHSARLPCPNMAIDRSEEHTSELQSLMRISYAVFCLKKKTSMNK